VTRLEDLCPRIANGPLHTRWTAQRLWGYERGQGKWRGLDGFRDLPASAARPTLTPRRLTARLSGKEGWCLLIGLVFLWQLVAWVVPARNRFLFPSPLLTAQALWASLPELGKGTFSSFIILIPGYAAAVVAGVVLAFWRGQRAGWSG